MKSKTRKKNQSKGSKGSKGSKPRGYAMYRMKKAWKCDEHPEKCANSSLTQHATHFYANKTFDREDQLKHERDFLSFFKNDRYSYYHSATEWREYYHLNTLKTFTKIVRDVSFEEFSADVLYTNFFAREVPHMTVEVFEATYNAATRKEKMKSTDIERVLKEEDVNLTNAQLLFNLLRNVHWNGIQRGATELFDLVWEEQDEDSNHPQRLLMINFHQCTLPALNSTADDLRTRFRYDYEHTPFRRLRGIENLIDQYMEMEEASITRFLQDALPEHLTRYLRDETFGDFVEEKIDPYEQIEAYDKASDFRGKSKEEILFYLKNPKNRITNKELFKLWIDMVQRFDDLGAFLDIFPVMSFNLKGQDGTRRSPIFFVKNRRTYHQLMDKGASLTQVDADSNNVFHIWQNPSVIEDGLRFIRMHQSNYLPVLMNGTNRAGRTPLTQAVYDRNLEKIELFLPLADATHKAQALSLALDKEIWPVVKYLYDNGAPVDMNLVKGWVEEDRFAKLGHLFRLIPVPFTQGMMDAIISRHHADVLFVVLRELIARRDLQNFAEVVNRIPNLPQVVAIQDDTGASLLDYSDVDRNFRDALVFRLGHTDKRKTFPPLQEQSVPRASGSVSGSASGSEDENEEWKCSICLDNEVSDENPKIWATPCGHAFHLGCLQEWNKSEGTCPNCKSELTGYTTFPTKSWGFGRKRGEKGKSRKTLSKKGKSRKTLSKKGKSKKTLSKTRKSRKTLSKKGKSRNIMTRQSGKKVTKRI